jgi:hypothetical protein
MKTKMLLNFTFSMMALAGATAHAETAPQEQAGEGGFSLNMPAASADSYMPNILTPVLVTHRESQANYVRAVVQGWQAMPALVEGPALPARDGANFLIDLNEWHKPIRIKTDIERQD